MRMLMLLRVAAIVLLRSLGVAPPLPHALDSRRHGCRRGDRSRLSRGGDEPPRPRADLPASHPHDRRAAAVRDAGRRHRRPLEPAPGRADGREGAHLLRDRHDARALHRMGGHHHQSRRRRHHAAAAVETTQIQQPGRTQLAGHRARHLPREHRPRGRRRRDAAGRRLQRALRRRARDAPGREAAADARLRREPRRDDVQVHAAS